MARLSAKAVVELLKPITWFPPMWAYGCGVVSAGTAFSGRGWAIAAGVLLAGPLVCGTSQAVNDWFDRHVDAINEPQRPIPSGRVPGRAGLYIAILWTGLSLVVAAQLGPIVLIAAALGLVLAWAYSAPPVRLKLNGWWGNTAVGFCYEGLPWVTGAAVMSLSGVPAAEVFAAAVLYSIGAHGIMTLNDFKAIEGDTQMGVRTLPVQLGARGAAQLACYVMVVPQVAMICLLILWGLPGFAAGVGAVLIAQLGCMPRLLRDPRAQAPWYNGTGITLYVSGMMITAFALRSAALAGAAPL